MRRDVGGTRNTRQKTLILQCLQSCAEHVTVEALGDLLKSRGTPVAKSTIYRTLAQLEQRQQVRKYTFSDGQGACYQYIGGDHACSEHYHLMCQSCGEVVHFDATRLQALFAGLREKEGFFIDGRRTVFYGLCGKCTSPAPQ